ncbi:putative disease resistance RPP13-like protein 1 [Cannabis sativa]|uniref:putative disease resistance RPP13-like protein 1 n=1 Tax=Cannabis sativa TaxID=3483 RepID=UPI0029CA48EF|nr:putative disease resistance RPP13-like protein 1 [Cannabis sativa]
MAELVVGPVVSFSVEFLLKKIASSDVASFLRGKKDSGFDRILDKLETTFLSLAKVLNDADQKQMRDPIVQKWLDKLQDVVEDAEDLFDEIEYDALKVKVETKSVKTKVSKFLSNFDSTDLDRKTEMEKLLERFETFEKQKDILNLQEGVEKIMTHRPPSMSTIDDSEFFGRDDEKKSLKGMLLSNEVDSEKIRVIPIVGLGGIGKTTLTQAVYNDDEVNKHFELKTWVCVSDEFDICKVMRNVHEAITRNTCAVENLIVLQENIQKRLKEKKFLIILDDVWCEKYEFWNAMKMIFRVGAQGSKIIVTTRSSKVVSIMGSIMGTTGFHHLKNLKEEACLKLFVKIVSRNEEFFMDPYSERIGKDIVRKCKGLPLAVKVLASLLCFTDVTQWERIAKCNVLDLPVGEENILPALRLSYHYLPSHLKRCFVYCSLFPKDYEFRIDELVRLWMVDNLLEHSNGNRTREEVGYEYFSDLVSRSFFQHSNVHAFRFIMHDLMVDLANFVSRKKFIQMERNKFYEIELMKQTRHVTVPLESCDIDELFKSISKGTCMRTILPVGPFIYTSNEFAQHVLKDLLKLKRLRFLSLKGFCCVDELPKSIDIKHTSV